jgi:hypothetical protein
MNAPATDTRHQGEHRMTTQFCPECEVSNDLHDYYTDGAIDADCERAWAKADLIERFGRMA